MTNSLRIKLAEALGWTGCKVDEEAVYCDDVTEPGYVTTRTLRGANKGYRQQLPDFSRYEAGAALLVEHLRGMGRWVRVASTLKPDVWHCEIMHTGHPEDRADAFATTLPLAIVAAACAVLAIDTSAKG